MGWHSWFQFQRGFQCWTWSLLAAGLGFSLLWKIFQNAAMEVVDFLVDFLRWITKEKSAKKSIGKSASWKQKIRRRTPPPKSTSQAQKSAVKPTNKSACQTSKYTLGFFDWEGLLWRRLQSTDSGTLVGCLLGMFEGPRLPCWNALAIPQLLLVGGTRFAAHPSRQHR